MPVHFFKPPARTDDLEPALAVFVSDLEKRGEEIVGAQPYGMLTAIFTRRPTPAKPAAVKKAGAK